MAQFNDSWRGGGAGLGAYTLQAATASQVPLIIKLAASQTAVGFKVVNSADSTLFSVDKDGNLSVAGSISAVINETVTGDLTLTGNLVVNGNSTLGNAAGDTVSILGTATFTPVATFTGGLSTADFVSFTGSDAVGAANTQIGRNANNHLQYNVPLTQQHIFSVEGTAAMTLSSTTMAVNTALVVGGNLTVNNGLDIGGVVSFDDGSAAAPSITFASDQDTGFYRSASNSISVASAGAADFTFSANTFAALSGSVITTNTLDATTPGTLTIGGGAGTQAITINQEDQTTTLNGYVAQVVTSLTGGQTAFDGTYTTTNTTNGTIIGHSITLAAGFTSSGLTQAMTFDNIVAGTSATYSTDGTYGSRPGGNRGMGGYTRATTIGVNTGLLGLARGGIQNWGGWLGSTDPEANKSNIGAIGLGFNDAAGGEGIGVYALYDNPAAVPTIPADIETALYANNAANAVPIAIFADNGTAVFTIADGGVVTATGGGSLTGTWTDLGSVSTIDINGGTADGIIIGGTTRAAGSFTTVGVDSAITGIVTSSLTVSIPTRLTDAATNDFTISGQNALVQIAASTNPDGGSLILQAGNGNTSDTTAGNGGDIELMPGKRGQFGDGGVFFYDNKADQNGYGKIVTDGGGLSDFFIDKMDAAEGISLGYASSGTYYRSLRALTVSTSVDYVQISGAAAAGSVLIEAAGTDAAIQLNIKSKGTDGIFFGNSTDIGILSHTGFAFDKAATATFSQDTETTDVATSDMTFNVQDAYASATGANRDAPDFVFNMGTAAAGGGPSSFLVNSSSGNPMFGISDGSGTISQMGQYNTAYKFTTDAQTTGAGTDTISLFSQGTSNDSAITVKGSVNAIMSDGSKVAMYTINAGYKNDGGVLSEVYDTTSTDFEDSAGNSAVIAASGTDIVITVTGTAAENYTWAVNLDITEVAL